MKSYPRIFVTGISTEVGKTVASAILTEALEADYWKPVQAGDLHLTDTHKVQHLVSRKSLVCHPEAYRLQHPMSPHAAARREGRTLDLATIHPPQTERPLVIEGAGGLLVPLNDSQTIADLLIHADKVVVVSRHYLGSINHTLLTVQFLKSRGIEPYLLFNGNENSDTEEVIRSMTGVVCIGRIDQAEEVTPEFVLSQAEKWREEFRKNLLT